MLFAHFAVQRYNIFFNYASFTNRFLQNLLKICILQLFFVLLHRNPVTLPVRVK